jgi:hypothetical protein
MGLGEGTRHEAAARRLRRGERHDEDGVAGTGLPVDLPRDRLEIRAKTSAAVATTASNDGSRSPMSRPATGLKARASRKYSGGDQRGGARRGAPAAGHRLSRRWA